MRRRFVIAGLLLVVAILSGGETVTRAGQLEGEMIVIAVPDPDSDGVVNIATGPEGDIVLFTGRSLGTTASFPCTVDPASMDHVQAVTVVDPGAGRAARRFDVIVLNRAEPLRPGSRLGNLVPAGNCTPPDGKFVRFSGTLE